MNKILVTCYVDPDLDGVAGAIAYSEFLNKKSQNTEVGIIGTPHDEARYLLDRYNFKYPKTIADDSEYEQVILVDASDINGLEGKVRPSKVIEIIDHRSVNEVEKFSRAKAQIELVGSAATLIAEKFMDNSVDISYQSAVLLYGAIISNTLNFKSTITSDRDKQAAYYLKKKAKLADDFWQELFLAKSDLSADKLQKRLDSDFAYFQIVDKKIGIAQIEIIGLDKLLHLRLNEIAVKLNELKKRYGLDYIFLNGIDLALACNFFVSFDQNSQELLTKLLNLSFVNGVAKKSNLMMRKQIVPLLKIELEN